MADYPFTIGAQRYSQGPHGGDVYRAAACMGISPSRILDFSSNTFILAKELTRRLLESTPFYFERYPDDDCMRLIQAISKHEAVESSRILPGNGSAALAWAWLQEMAPRRVLLIGPAFSEYARACRILGIEMEIITPPEENGFDFSEEVLQKVWASRADAAVFCTPNNPAGVTYEGVHALIAAIRAPRILADLSYREFLYGEEAYAQNSWPRYQSLVMQGSSIFCLHSFTKFFCSPGVRLGYMTGDPLILRHMAEKKPHWEINQIAQDLGVCMLENIAEYRALLPRLRQLRYEFGMALRHLSLFDPDRVFEGPDFFCCGLRRNTELSARLKHAAPKANEIQEALLRRCILVRNCDTIPGMPPGYLRVQVREEEDCEKLVEALTKLG